MTSQHYFRFSTDFDGNGRRRCGECRQPYDDGDHIEITTLKPYTSYVCPTGGGLGHSSTWTGAYQPSLRTLRDHLCICGAEFVEEDAEQWRLSWEMQTPQTGHEWKPVQAVRSRHAVHQQRDGLIELIDRGEPIRNVVLEQIDGVRLAARPSADTETLRRVLLNHHPLVRSETGPLSGCRCGQVKLGQDVIAHVAAQLVAALASPAPAPQGGGQR